jgi:hypothetical protein
MQTQTKNQVSITSTKSSPVAVKAEITPWPQPQTAKLDPITTHLAEMVAHRSQNYLGRGIPYSPLND